MVRRPRVLRGRHVVDILVYYFALKPATHTFASAPRARGVAVAEMTGEARGVAVAEMTGEPRTEPPVSNFEAYILYKPLVLPAWLSGAAVGKLFSWLRWKVRCSFSARLNRL